MPAGRCETLLSTRPRGDRGTLFDDPGLLRVAVVPTATAILSREGLKLGEYSSARLDEDQTRRFGLLQKSGIGATDD